MTSLALALWIAAAILLQIAVYLAIGFWNHWLEYRALRHRADELNLPALEETPDEEFVPNVACWSGLRSFRVDRKVFEDVAQSICSFYLVPEDGQALPPFKPGQFITFTLGIPVPGGQQKIVRCYSLSDAPHADHYRVSIKRVPAPPDSSLPPGLGSSYFHDQVAVGSKLQVRAPSGHFHIDQGHAPVVLIGGGIGITPMLSMLYWLLAQQPQREVWLFYGVRNSQELVMAPQLRQLAAQHPQFHLQLCFSNPLPGDQPGRDFQHQGRVDIQLLRLLLPLKPFHYYICGPGPMMQSMVAALEDWGVPDSQIHYEAFGPASIKRQWLRHSR
jgi:ferredoxin-NADP reductase